jgi:hypothetical protein
LDAVVVVDAAVLDEVERDVPVVAVVAPDVAAVVLGDVVTAATFLLVVDLVWVALAAMAEPMPTKATTLRPATAMRARWAG